MVVSTSPVKTRSRAAAVFRMAAGSGPQARIARQFAAGFAAAIPALVRSEIRARSSWATALSTWRKTCLAASRCRSDRAGIESARPGLQPLDDLQQVANGAGEAVEPDHDKDVAGTDFLEKAGEFRSGPRSAGPVFLEDRRAAGSPQFVDLGVGRRSSVETRA